MLSGTKGKLQKCGREWYYSPNSTLPLTLPDDQRASSDSRANPFHPIAAVPLADLLHPQPWSPAFGWLAFLPVAPFPYDTYPLSVLRGAYVVVQKPDGRYGLKKRVKDSWTWLGYALYHAITTLKNVYHIPMVLPYFPSAWGYLKNYQTPGEAQEAAWQSSDWFTVWLAALSYSIAVVESMPRHHPPSKQAPSSSLPDSSAISPSVDALHPAWFTAIINADAGRSQISQNNLYPWLEGIQMSAVCDFKHLPRLGCIVNLINPASGQPHVTWFLENNAPLWYRWDAQEHELASRNPCLRALAPPNHLLPSHLPPLPEIRKATTDQSQPSKDGTQASNPSTQKAPLAHPSPPAVAHTAPNQSVTSPTAPSSSPSVVQPEWLVYRLAHEARHTRMLEQEATDPQKRQARLNRERQPPFRNVRVVEWHSEPSDSKSVHYTRSVESLKYSADTLQKYGPGQKVFDSFCVEWTCCADWPLDTTDMSDPYFHDGDDSNDWEGFRMKNVRREKDPQPPPMISTESQCLPPPPLNDSSPLSPVPTDVDPRAPFVHPSRLNTTAMGSQSLAEEEEHADHAFDQDQQMPAGDEEKAVAGFEREVESTLGQYYGFVQPLPASLAPQPRNKPTEQDIQWFCRVLGLAKGASEATASYFVSSHYIAARAFVDALSRRRQSPSGTYDLSEDCPSYLKTLPCFPFLRTMNVDHFSQEMVDRGSGDAAKVYYYFQADPNKPEPDWRLVVPSPINALLICRLPVEMTQDDIGHYLLQRGIPFRAFVKSSLVLSRPFKAVALLASPTRPFNHVFTGADYDSYVNMRTLLLGQPHMQATLRRGGLIWRLALSSLGLFDGLRVSASAGSTIYIQFPGSAIVYQEDGLTITELDLLCGAYVCISGKLLSLPPLRWKLNLAKMMESSRHSSRGGLWYDIMKKSNAGRTMAIDVTGGSVGIWAVSAISMLRWLAIVSHAHMVNGSLASMGLHPSESFTTRPASTHLPSYQTISKHSESSISEQSYSGQSSERELQEITDELQRLELGLALATSAPNRIPNPPGLIPRSPIDLIACDEDIPAFFKAPVEHILRESEQERYHRWASAITEADSSVHLFLGFDIPVKHFSFLLQSFPDAELFILASQPTHWIREGDSEKWRLLLSKLDQIVCIHAQLQLEEHGEAFVRLLEKPARKLRHCTVIFRDESTTALYARRSGDVFQGQAPSLRELRLIDRSHLHNHGETSVLPSALVSRLRMSSSSDAFLESYGALRVLRSLHLHGVSPVAPSSTKSDDIHLLLPSLMDLSIVGPLLSSSLLLHIIKPHANCSTHVTFTGDAETAAADETLAFVGKALAGDIPSDDRLAGATVGWSSEGEFTLQFEGNASQKHAFRFSLKPLANRALHPLHRLLFLFGDYRQPGTPDTFLLGLWESIDRSRPKLFASIPTLCLTASGSCQPSVGSLPRSLLNLLTRFESVSTLKLLTLWGGFPHFFSVIRDYDQCQRPLLPSLRHLEIPMTSSDNYGIVSSGVLTYLRWRKFAVRQPLTTVQVDFAVERSAEGDGAVDGGVLAELVAAWKEVDIQIKLRHH
ncbi:hypothetical protein BKA70DRAFT_1236454 [Coprinopsis sp. MPI-PUGE-AT-0042]|nr:hypothetical protein BKA70DRAFT_1236454 [Coprinopsis sp. MPI-PUGE-AT-0042]